jgi:N-acetylmuramic acid 6-phosphate etherase
VTDDALASLSTEQANQATLDLDERSTLGILQAMSDEDATAVAAVRRALPEIAQTVDLVADRVAQGGRLIYVGAGTSGRLGVLDASECPPTFGVPPGLVVGIIAGGDPALRRSSEGVEDHPRLGARDLEAVQVGSLDTVVGITASGRAPYVAGALQYARRCGAAIVAVVNHEPAEIAAHAQITIALLTGPEVLAGSTRLKAGTAQKLVLNMISTAAFVRLGYVYGNWMVNLRPTNVKLKARAVRIVQQAGGVDAETARRLLSRARNRVKVALVMAKTGKDAREATRRLEAAGGWVRTAIQAAAAPQPEAGRLEAPGSSDRITSTAGGDAGQVQDDLALV